MYSIKIKKIINKRLERLVFVFNLMGIITYKIQINIYVNLYDIFNYMFMFIVLFFLFILKKIKIK